jgi:hypothetical protein
MTTITLPADIEGPLTEEARRRGTTPEGLALETLRLRFTPPAALASGESEERSELEEWYRELQDLGPAQYDPGEWERVQATLTEADELAKAVVRRQMGLP